MSESNKPKLFSPLRPIKLLFLLWIVFSREILFHKELWNEQPFLPIFAWFLSLVAIVRVCYIWLVDYSLLAVPVFVFAEIYFYLSLNLAQDAIYQYWRVKLDE